MMAASKDTAAYPEGYDSQEADLLKSRLWRGEPAQAWELAFVLAGKNQPEPTLGPPKVFRKEELPAIVLAALRWISEAAAGNAYSELDAGARERGSRSYLVKPAVALDLLSRAEKVADRWGAMPYVRVLDAAFVICGEEPPTGLKRIQDLSKKKRDLVKEICAKTGQRAQSKWSPYIVDQSDWITDAQLKKLKKGWGPKRKPITEAPPRPAEIQRRAILAAIRDRGLDPKRFPKHPVGQHTGSIKTEIREQLARGPLFGGPAEQRRETFDSRWRELRRSKEILDTPDPG